MTSPAPDGPPQPQDPAENPSAEAAPEAAPAEAPDAPGGGPAARSRAPRRALALALLCGAVGAALALVASGQVWSESSVSFAQGTLPVEVKGSEATGLPSALALVGLAALVAVFAVRRAGRLVVAGLLTLCGVGTLVSALAGARDTAPLEEKAAEASGLAQATVDTVHIGSWPYLSAVGGALLLLAGLLALWFGRAWPSMAGSGRYERGPRKPRTAPAVDPDRPEDLWKALDRGEDPTGTAQDPAEDAEDLADTAADTTRDKPNGTP
ncbi:TIGR02234 family membrane protein [Streptomyces sp. HNM0574]|uniref:TIGR02234 family membrane protein n=1 Tax=Streptomyces sp. HNM0574 TaxID=2714954 RepID=UPI00146E0013|nr:TIGR02234 family membrane protein [Streptomyces sp. HNM0574]